ncbi:MAG: hypothetical protein V7K32_13690 [Nostoc sp.]|uniref:hypothetical protein n=1 Tax=Nostoc sp. TaxID=1180 RepID=UPI002FFA535A
MTFILNSQNVFDYLVKKGLCNQSDQPPIKIEQLTAKNFNLLLSLPGDRKLLVKQERYNHEGKAAGEFLSEWRIQEFLQRFPNLGNYHSFLPEVLHYQKSFGNMGIAMLQVAKTLLSRPVQSMPTIFGTAAVELTHLSSSAV